MTVVITVDFYFILPTTCSDSCDRSSPSFKPSLTYQHFKCNYTRVHIQYFLHYEEDVKVTQQISSLPICSKTIYLHCVEVKLHCLLSVAILVCKPIPRDRLQRPASSLGSRGQQQIQLVSTRHWCLE